MQGWIKIHRQLLEHWVADEPECLAVWVRMLIEANHATKKKLFNGRMTEIQRGQLLFGLQRFSEKSGVSIAKLRRYLKLFMSEGMIDRQVDNKYSLITITCYDDFQESTGKKQAENKLTTSEKQHLKNVKNVKNSNTSVVSDDTTRRKPTGSIIYPDEFNWIWERRPPRVGTNNKHDAFKAAKARIKGGCTWKELAQGLINYSRFLEKTGSLNTPHVMMLRTFFGPAQHYKSDWSIDNDTNTKNNTGGKSAAEQVKAAFSAEEQRNQSSGAVGDGGQLVRTEMDQGLGADTKPPFEKFIGSNNT